MDQRRFRSLCGAGIFLITLAVNGRTLIAAFTGDFSADYVLLRYIAALLIGYIGMRVMDSILFRPRRPAPAARTSSPERAAPAMPSDEQVVDTP